MMESETMESNARRKVRGGGYSIQTRYQHRCITFPVIDVRSALSLISTLRNRRNVLQLTVFSSCNDGRDMEPPNSSIYYFQVTEAAGNPV